MNNTQQCQKCLGKLILATKLLKVEVDTNELYEITDLIIQPMTGPWRFFHTLEHTFEVGGNEDGIEILAGLFHDIVYVQVDRCISLNISHYISPFIKEVKGELIIRETDLPKDEIFEMVASVFGFLPGEKLNISAGQNEFLSAIIAAKVLSKFLSAQHLLQIIGCIEATIPFRLATDLGLTPCESLYQRLLATNEKFKLSLTDEEIQETVKKGVRVANRDVGSFAYPNPANFLAKTWSLLPETNHNLIAVTSYTISDYRASIQKTEAFMNSLTEENIFRQYQSEPEDKTYQLLLTKAKYNLEIARLYLACKLVTIALVEGLSFAIGLDISLATMMGEVPYRGFIFTRLENFLPDIPNKYKFQNDQEKQVFDLLEKGRAKSAEYDLENSPLATYIVKSIGFARTQYQYQRAKEFFQGKIAAENFIAGFPVEVSQNIIAAVEKMFENRKTSIAMYSQIISQSISKYQSNF